MPRRTVSFVPDSALGRVLGLLLSVALVALGFVLLTAALVLGGLMALVAVGRLAWLRWSADRDEGRGTIEVEYEVDDQGASRRHRGDPPGLGRGTGPRQD